MTIRSTWLRCLGVCAILFCSSTSANAQVDLQATRAYLLTGINSGSEVVTPALGQELFVHVDYKVVGGTAGFSADVRALIDGVEQCGGPLDFGPNDDKVIWCEIGFTATAGTHTLRWELDTQNQVSESNENNNAVEFTFTTAAAGSRDLEALRAFLRTQPNGGDEVAHPALGQQVYVHFEYRIGGSGAVFTANVAATLDGESFCSGPISFTPNTDGVVWCDDAWTATAGTHTLRWEVDSSGAINETDETNNVAQVTFTTGGTTAIDIEAERAFLRTQPNGGDEITQPAVGQAVYFHADYVVTGTNAALEADVRAVIDGEDHCGGATSLDPEPGTLWCDDPWTATAGRHTLRWILDSENGIEESAEDNNSAVTTFVVGGPALCVGDCDENGSVVVNELVTGVNIALDRADIEDCPAFDLNDNGIVEINELVSGVDNLLRGCG